MKDKRLHKFIAITLCVTLLTISASRVTRVSAVGTTVAAVAGAATLAVGIGFLSYCALSGMAIHCPDSVAKVEDWLTTVGQKVIQYPSGRAAYEDMYERMLNEPVTDLLDRAWDWSQEKLFGFANDFSDTRVISSILTYENVLDTFNVITADFTYPKPLAGSPALVDMSGTTMSMSDFLSIGYTIDITTGAPFIRESSQYMYITSTNVNTPVRNVLTSNGRYYSQTYVDGHWTSTRFNYGIPVYDVGGDLEGYLLQHLDVNVYRFGVSAYSYNMSSQSTYPVFPQADIYVEATGEVISASDVTDREVVGPSWPDVNDTDEEVEYPIVPYVQYPVDRYGGGQNPNPRWGFGLDDLLDILAELGEDIFDLTVLKELLNRFAGDHTGDSYIYYDYSENGTTYNNFNYYTNVNYADDYVTYNIDVSHVDEELPVDLNTIQIYTNNRYLDEVKRSALAGGSIIRDLVVFWYDVDPLIVYVFFGSCIAILVAAFIGKWGHS